MLTLYCFVITDVQPESTTEVVTTVSETIVRPREVPAEVSTARIALPRAARVKPQETELTPETISTEITAMDEKKHIAQEEAIPDTEQSTAAVELPMPTQVLPQTGVPEEEIGDELGRESPKLAEEDSLPEHTLATKEEAQPSLVLPQTEDFTPDIVSEELVPASSEEVAPNKFLSKQYLQPNNFQSQPELVCKGLM